MTPEELAAIRERAAAFSHDGEDWTYTWTRDDGQQRSKRGVVDPDAMHDRRALLAHIDAITEAVEGMRTYPFKEAPYGDEPHAMVLQSAVLALLRGTPQ